MNVINSGAPLAQHAAPVARSGKGLRSPPLRPGAAPTSAFEAASPSASSCSSSSAIKALSGGDEVPAAARTLMMLSSDAVGRCRDRAAAAAEKRSSRPYKFVPKREDDRILIEAFRRAVATARERGLTNEHISAEIGESGMSANLISKVVHGHRGLGRFRPAVAAWSQQFCEDLYAPGELSVQHTSDDMDVDDDCDDDDDDVDDDDDEDDGDEADADADVDEDVNGAVKMAAPDTSVTTGGGGGGRNGAGGGSSSNSSGGGYKFEPRTEEDRRLLEDFRVAVSAARKRGWTNEKIAREIGALNANVVSKLVHGHQGLGRYRATVAAWSGQVLHAMRQQPQLRHERSSAQLAVRQ